VFRLTKDRAINSLGGNCPWPLLVIGVESEYGILPRPLARLFESLPLVCPHCGADVRIVAFITEAATVAQILNHIGEPAEPPRISPARGPPAWDDPPVEALPDWGALVQPQPE